MIEAGFAFHNSNIMFLNQGLIAVAQEFVYRGPTYHIVHLGPIDSSPPMINIPNGTPLIKFTITPFQNTSSVKRFGRGQNRVKDNDQEDNFKDGSKQNGTANHQGQPGQFLDQ